MYKEWHLVSKNSSDPGHLSRAPPHPELAVCTQTGQSQPESGSKHWQTPKGGCRQAWGTQHPRGSGDTPPTLRPSNPTHCLTCLIHFPTFPSFQSVLHYFPSPVPATQVPTKPDHTATPSTPASRPATPFTLEDVDACCTFLLFFPNPPPLSLSPPFPSYHWHPLRRPRSDYTAPQLTALTGSPHLRTTATALKVQPPRAPPLALQAIHNSPWAPSEVPRQRTVWSQST